MDDRLIRHLISSVLILATMLCINPVVLGEIPPLTFEQVWHTPLSKDRLCFSESGCVHDGVLYIWAYKSMVFDGSTGAALKMPDWVTDTHYIFRSTPEGLLVGSNRMLVYNPDGHSVTTHGMALYEDPQKPAKWSIKSPHGVSLVAFGEGRAFVAARNGDVTGALAANGTVLNHGVFPVESPEGFDDRVSVRAEGMAYVSGKIAVMAQVEVERRMKKKDIPKGTPSSWERGMPDDEAYIPLKHEIVVAAWNVSGKGEVKPLWRVALKDPDVCPGPSLFATPSGNFGVFTGRESRVLDPDTGEAVTTKTLAKTLNYFDYAGADRLVLQDETSVTLWNLETLEPAWSIEEPRARRRLRQAGRFHGKVVTYAIAIERKSDCGQYTDVRLRLRDPETGQLIAEKTWKKRGLSYLFIGDEHLYIHDVKGAWGYRVVAASSGK